MRIIVETVTVFFKDYDLFETFSNYTDFLLNKLYADPKFKIESDQLTTGNDFLNRLVVYKAITFEEAEKIDIKDYEKLSIRSTRINTSGEFEKFATNIIERYNNKKWFRICKKS